MLQASVLRGTKSNGSDGVDAGVDSAFQSLPTGSQDAPWDQLSRRAGGTRTRLAETGKPKSEEGNDTAGVDTVSSGGAATSTGSLTEEPSRWAEALQYKSHVIHSPQALAQVGGHYLREILKCLDDIVRIGQVSAASVSPMLHAMKDLCDYAPGHAASHVSIALYDAMVADDRWHEYSVEQYGKAAGILREAGKEPLARNSAIERWLAQVWELGFDITPFDAVLVPSPVERGN